VSDTALVVETRDGAGKGVARKLRAAGLIPGVFYGNNEEPRSISADPTVLKNLLDKSDAGMNTLIDVTIAGESGEAIALVKEIQRDPVSNRYLHFDLVRVDVTHRIHVTVPIHIAGVAVGVRLGGGIMDQSMRELDLECLPRAIPTEILADVDELDVGDSLHVRDLVLPEGVKLLNDPELPVVSVVAPTIEEEPEVVEEEAEAAEGTEAPADDDTKAEDKPAEGSGD
jgi:large subunit ribosomal protein L25